MANLDDLDRLFDIKPTEGKPPLMVDLNAPAHPAILSGLLDLAKTDIYAAYKNGRLPANKEATLSECLKHYYTWLKGRASSKKLNVVEALAEQKIKLEKAKTEATWLEISKARGFLIDKTELALRFEPMFSSVRQQLLTLSRQHKDAAPDIEKILSYWNELGRAMMEKTEGQMDEYIQAMIDEELHFEPSGDEDE